MTTSAEKGFLKEAEGPHGLFGVFEDDNESGYLYVYEPDGKGIRRDLHVYDRTPQVDVSEDDVYVMWSDDHSKVGVVIWGKMRGIIELASRREGRAWLESRTSSGIADPEWLKGFATEG